MEDLDERVEALVETYQAGTWSKLTAAERQAMVSMHQIALDAMAGLTTTQDVEAVMVEVDGLPGLDAGIRDRFVECLEMLRDAVVAGAFGESS